MKINVETGEAMPTVEQFLDIFEAMARKDWSHFKDVTESVAEYERKKKHYSAAAKIREAAASVMARNETNEEFVFSSQSTSPLPFDLLRKTNLQNLNLSIPHWLEKELSSFFKEWESKDKLQKAGILPRNTILLHGAPGCGKTVLAHHIANQLGRDIYTVRFDALVSSYLGETGSNIRKIFDFAKNNKCVLFLDEIDAIAKLRDDTTELGELKRVVITLLQNIDTLNPETMLISATNHAHMLDPAIWRRFDIVWEMLPPLDDVRINFFKNGFELFVNDPVLRECIITVTKGMTGAEIKRTINECKRKIILDPYLAEGEAYLLAVIDHLRRGERGGVIEKADVTLTDVVIFLRKLYKKKYTFAKLEEVTGIPHSTLHHKIKNRSNA